MRKDVIFSLFLTSGLLLAAISILNGKMQSLNLGDTYYLISAGHFAILIVLIFLCQAVLYYFIRHHRREILGIIQLVTFAIPLLYFMFYDNIVPKPTPANYPSFWYSLQEHYIPMMMTYMFVISILLLMRNMIYAVIQFNKVPR